MTAWQAATQVASDVPARPSGLWTLVVEFVEGPALLKITASEGRWSYAADTPAAECGADGDPDGVIARARCLLPAAPAGALIGKIGGSSAGIDDGTVFVAGRTCVVRVAESGGPLYLTINDEYSGMSNNAGSLQAQVSWCAVEAAKS